MQSFEFLAADYEKRSLAVKCSKGHVFGVRCISSIVAGNLRCDTCAQEERPDWPQVGDTFLVNPYTPLTTFFVRVRELVRTPEGWSVRYKTENDLSGSLLTRPLEQFREMVQEYVDIINWRKSKIAV